MVFAIEGEGIAGITGFAQRAAALRPTWLPRWSFLPEARR